MEAGEGGNHVHSGRLSTRKAVLRFLQGWMDSPDPWGRHVDLEKKKTGFAGEKLFPIRRGPHVLDTVLEKRHGSTGGRLGCPSRLEER